MAGDVAGPRSLRQLLSAVLMIGSDLDLPSMLLRIAEAAVDLVDARYGALGVLNEQKTGLAEFITVGFDDDTRAKVGSLPKGLGILGLLITDAKPIRLVDLKDHPASAGFPPNHPPMTTFLGVPIRVRGEVFGNLYLTDKTSGEVFTDVDEELVLGLASAAGVAIENARASQQAQRLHLLEDQERIARDLHDTVIQRLFATGLSLQGALRFVSDDQARHRVESAIDDLDETVRHIRTVIFDIGRATESKPGVRTRVLDLTREAGRVLGFDPHVTFDGAIDAAVSDPIADELVATLREALSNVARHAHATHVEVQLAVSSDVRLVVVDDGVGLAGSAAHGDGLGNMRTRAERLNGTFVIERARPDGGTRVEWTVPIASS